MDSSTQSIRTSLHIRVWSVPLRPRRWVSSLYLHWRWTRSVKSCQRRIASYDACHHLARWLSYLRKHFSISIIITPSSIVQQCKSKHSRPIWLWQLQASVHCWAMTKKLNISDWLYILMYETLSSAYVSLSTALIIAHHVLWQQRDLGSADYVAPQYRGKPPW